MVNWGKRPEFNAQSIPGWRRRLDWVLLGLGLALTAYNGAYVGLGLYYGEIDHEKERVDFRKAEERVHQVLFGRGLSEMPEGYRKLHESVSLIELAAQIRENEGVKTSGSESDTPKSALPLEQESKSSSE